MEWSDRIGLCSSFFSFFFFNQHVQEPVPILLCRSARRLVAFRYRPSLSLALISNFHFLYFGRSWSLSLRVFFVFCCFIICFIPNAQSSKTVIDCTRSSVGHRSIQQFPHRDEPNREFSFSFLSVSFYTHAHNWRVRRDLLPWWIVFDTYRRQINKNTATDAMKRNSNFHFCFVLVRSSINKTNKTIHGRLHKASACSRGVMEYLMNANGRSVTTASIYCAVQTIQKRNEWR